MAIGTGSGAPVKVTDAFVARLRRAGEPQYRLASAVGRPPSWLSAVIRATSVSASDQDDVIRIGRRLGLEPDQVFVANDERVSA